MMDDLDALFATARGADVQPTKALMARVMADAVALQPKPLPLVRAAARETGFWAGLSALFGGGGVLAGLGSVAMTGFYLGLVQPAPLLALSDAYLSTASVDAVDLMPGVDALLTED